MANAASAASVITVNPDKTLSIDGKKTFPLLMYHWCQTSFSDSACLSYLQNGVYDVNVLGAVSGGMDAGFIQDHEQTNKMFTRGALYFSSTSSSILTSDSFFGWYQPDEPKAGSYGCTDVSTDEECMQKLTGSYKTIKAADPNHIIITSQWKELEKWKSTGDVEVFGIYPFKDNFMAAFGGRNNSLYGYEYLVKTTPLSGTANFDTLTRPGYPVIQAVSCKDEAGVQPLTHSEIRSLAYTAITFNAKGLAYYTFSGTPNGCGLYKNPELVADYNNIAKEIASFNDILVLPTKDYSWEYRKGADVTFSKNLTHDLWVHDKITGQRLYKIRTSTNFNYMLKQDSTTNYLIVVNKDSRSISNVDIIFKGLTGTMTAKTLGFTEAGSVPGRTLPVANGKFTDSFDGYAVHIYQICSGTCPALPNPNPTPTCYDSIQNQGETGIDCGGPCPACSSSGNQLTLKPGWNQISSPIATGIDIATIGQSCTILPYKNQKLWSWNATSQVWINPSKVEPFRGYWIYAAYPCTVPLSGTPAQFTTLQLFNGWNKISAKGELNSIKRDCQIADNWIWHWDKATERWGHPTVMQLDKGYWIKVNQSCVMGG